jgi:nicotinamidase-related amidase
MSEFAPLDRSPDLMNAADTALLVVDVQEKLIGRIPHHRRLIWNIDRLLDGANILGLPCFATEQYPQGLGATIAPLAAKLGEIPAKLAFSCAGCAGPWAEWEARGITRILVTGIEAHVCVQQTVFDLMAAGFRVYLAVDAIGSRFEVDREIAMRRMESSGAALTTTEAALFEWCQRAGTPEFKQISQLVKQVEPGRENPKTE